MREIDHSLFTRSSGSLPLATQARAECNQSKSSAPTPNDVHHCWNLGGRTVEKGMSDFLGQFSWEFRVRV